MIDIQEFEGNAFMVSLHSPKAVDDEKNFLGFLDALLELTHFGFILSVEGESSFSIEAKKQLNLWFKENRSTISSRCFAFVRLVQGGDAGKFKTKALENALGCPYFVESSLEESISSLFSCRGDLFK